MATSTLIILHRRLTWIAMVIIVCAGPPIMGVTSVFAIFAGSYYRYQRRATPFSALVYAWNEIVSAIKAAGPLGFAVLGFIYVLSFGIVIAVTLISMRWWNPKRAFWFLFLASSVIIVASLTSEPLRLIPERVSYYASTGLPSPPYFFMELHIMYSAYIIPIALFTGWLITLHPIFKPGKRYWLARGMCPKCHYDLQHKTDAGCPECGWNRPAQSKT